MRLAVASMFSMRPLVLDAIRLLHERLLYVGHVGHQTQHHLAEQLDQRSPIRPADRNQQHEQARLAHSLRELMGCPTPRREKGGCAKSDHDRGARRNRTSRADEDV
jgi:hypothetical protein